MSWIYTATNPECGHVTAAVVDRPEHAREVAKDLGQWVRDGLTISRVKSKASIQWCDDSCPAMARLRERLGIVVKR